MLTESIAIRADIVRLDASKGIGAAVLRNLNDTRPTYSVSTHQTLLRALVQLSKCIRPGSQMFGAHKAADKPPVLGFTLKQARNEKIMPKYTYTLRIRAERKIKNAVMSPVGSTGVPGIAVVTPFATPGGLELMSDRLISAMRDGVERVQVAYSLRRKNVRYAI